MLKVKKTVNRNKQTQVQKSTRSRQSYQAVVSRIRESTFERTARPIAREFCLVTHTHMV